MSSSRSLTDACSTIAANSKFTGGLSKPGASPLDVKTKMMGSSGSRGMVALAFLFPASLAYML